MNARSLSLWLLVWLVLTGGARAELRVISHGPDALAVTIYRDDLALISETRRVELPAGRSTIEFEGVSDRIIPQSALLQEFGAITIERNFDFDLLSPATFFESAIGETVILTRTSMATGRMTRVEAKVVSAGPQQGVVFKTDDGVEAYQCGGLREGISAASMPGSLRARPTLSIDVEAESAGPQELTISYLASGFGWQADYILTVSEDASKGDLIGWLTVNNGTALGVDEAETAIVAGSLQRLDDTESPATRPPYFFARCWPRGSTKTGIDRSGPPPPPAVRDSDAFMRPSLSEREADMAADEIVITAARRARREDLGDYKLYRTPEPTTLAAQQTKQVLFLNAESVGVEKVYAYKLATPLDHEDEDAAPASIEYRIDNSRGGALAQPLPAGTVRVMTSRAGGQQFFLGEDDVDDLAVGLPVKIDAAEAVDVRMRTVVKKAVEKEIGDNYRQQVTVEHHISSALDMPVTIEVSVGNDFGAAMKIDRANSSRLRGEPLPTWRIRLEPNSTQVLSYRATWIE